ncbi:Fe-S cluster assembly ATPase SufC [Tissierella praeacuta]|uniref:Fe-S cluster assembly ATP-binding protein n=1 Tax=Tissierella praeacuta DSM 18095 TaxID=1123404 RepID=A0A1M4UEN6_9FIRM|nr:Fe-S cluster assembly ATPase SufC [Tissierella praeacuta]TCU77198.1 Fe-S cluster assembly ATP-binding protein [Tissierella praeacuta]SHE55144.1 Fe-S cluster assembly ATP-binding protein [Tissierella praeacuta DSM 18095]SUP03940.1 Vegetative protein 296 [Tissierella praeacuta]
MAKNLLNINSLKVNIEGKEILKGLSLQVREGETHVIMGPNGGGKSTLAYTLMGHPKYEITGGEIEFEGELINNLKADKRAKKGIFLSFQYPEEIPGVTVEEFLRTAKTSVSGEIQKLIPFKKLLKEKMEQLEMKEEYASRYLNLGFSGGEKKKNEILQMSILEPKLAILDETDSGLDVDAIRIVAEGVKKIKDEKNSILVITHYNKLLDYLNPDYIHILLDGKIVKTGGIELAKEIDEMGYENIKSEFSIK